MIQSIGLSADLSAHIADLVLTAGADSPLSIAQTKIILPTRRACLSVKNAFLRRSADKPLILPRLIPLYDLDTLDTDIPPAMPRLTRTLLLAKLCAAKPHVTAADQAFKMAASLGDLLDEFYQFETDPSRLSDLVKNPIFAEHWNETVSFLDIIVREWPHILKEHGKIDEADRQIRLINAYTDRIRQSTDRIIAAGLDGGLPAARRLMKAVNELKNGLVILEGADPNTDTSSKALAPYHYQNGIRQILNDLNSRPQPICSAETPRESLIREALKPESQTEEWRHFRTTEKALADVRRIDCDTVAEEALNIAILLRGALETPERTACLVTPDRQLARRVILEMKRWGIQLDDSAGTPINQTEVGSFLRLLAEPNLSRNSDSDKLALFKHPLSADGCDPTVFRRRVKQAEKEARSDQKPLSLELKTDLDTWTALFANGSLLTPFRVLLTEHIRVAEALATSHDRSGADRLWQSDAGRTLFEFLTTLTEQADLIDDIEPAAYPAILDILMGSLTVRPRYGMHPRLDILGPIEARFHHYDVCIIGGLNEGTFPGIPDVGPWLNRPMRTELGLPQPEAKIAALSMDFAHCFCSPRVILTRSRKSDGAETIPSRFLARLDAVLTGSNLTVPRLTGNLGKALDRPVKADPPVRPAPCPPVSARPKSLSVTKVELWMRNPYAIYARYILHLFPLKPLRNPEKQQLYGSAVHQALEEFVTNCPEGSRQDLIQLLSKAMTDKGLSESDKVFFLNRFGAAADFILERQAEVRGQIAKTLPERTGSLTLSVGESDFTLTGTADRIDILKNGTCRILDYKTGQAPSVKEVCAGYAPQLPLEALLLARGGFQEAPPAPISSMAYWKLAAKSEDCKEIILTEKQSADDLIQTAEDGLKNLILTFNRPETKYEVCPIAGREPAYDDYDHLSRFAEWGHGGDE